MATINIRDIPQDVHAEFKIICIEKDINMPDMVMELALAEIDKMGIPLQPKGKTIDIIIKEVPVSINKDFRILCHSKGVNIQERIIELITDDVADADMGCIYENL